jgi:hypothetical protein
LRRGVPALTKATPAQGLDTPLNAHEANTGTLRTLKHTLHFKR